MSQYPTNLTDKQWQITEIILDSQHPKRKYSLRDIMDAIMYIVKTGGQWRMLPRDFPPFNTVFYYFNKWKLESVFEELVDTLHVVVRKLMGREAIPVWESLIPEASSPLTTLLLTVALTATKRLKGTRNTLSLIHLSSLWVS